MKILLISNMYPSFVKNFENGIIESGGTVHKAVMEVRGMNAAAKVLKYIKFFFDVYLSLFTIKYDLIYVHYAKHSLIPILPIKFLLKKPLVVNAHGDDIEDGSLLSRLVAPIIKKAELLVVPSEYFADIAQNKNLNQHIFVSPSGGIDTSLFKPLGTEIDKVFFTIGYVSRIIEGKGWDTLLLATEELKKLKIARFKVKIIGGGTQANELESVITQMGLQKEVEYLGAIPYKDLGYHYNTFDLFVFPTTRVAESLGLVGLEAMACGIPVVGSNIGGLKSYIKNGHNGELFEPGNQNALFRCIEKFMVLDENEKKLYCQNAIATAKEYDSKIVSKKLFGRLVKLLESSKK